MNTIPQRLVAALLIAGLAACGGDSKPADPAANKPTVSPDDFRKAQQAYADSVLNQAVTASSVVQKLGAGYEVGSVRLRDTLAALAGKTECFLNGRQADPYLAGTVTFFTFMSVVGTNVIRVQESQWTSQAGNIVNSCLNLAAAKWKLDATFGKPASYITQAQFK
ncbi:MAG: hypothetical protein FJ202_07065 [Gemmatimonadetes bacterium]|nr:hypothetical protein [Gemmatimonadota bacterium]